MVLCSKKLWILCSVYRNVKQISLFGQGYCATGDVPNVTMTMAMITCHLINLIDQQKCNSSYMLRFPESQETKILL